MANGFSLSLLRFVARGFFEKPAFPVTMCLGLLLSQGCALLQSQPDIAAPVEKPAQPAPAQPTAKKVLPYRQNCHKPA